MPRPKFSFGTLPIATIQRRAASRRKPILPDRCELSRASVNRHLAILEKRVLIARERLFDVERQRQLPTRYYLAFEPDFEQHRDRLTASPKRGLKPCRNSGHGAESQIQRKPRLKLRL